MQHEELLKTIATTCSQVQAAMGKMYVEITVPAGRLHSTMQVLRDTPELSFDYLFSLTGTDINSTLGVVYHLESTKHRHVVVVKTTTEDRTTPVLDSVCDLWQTANLNEREAFDLLGIRFTNHPDLRRILLDDDFTGHPLRKDYQDEHIIER